MLLTQLGIAQLLCADLHLGHLRHDLRSAHAAWAASSVSAGAGFTLQVTCTCTSCRVAHAFITWR
jgi:hypothetical protein